MTGQLIQRGVELIEASKRILVFVGAGLSTESGIPDFRSPGGVWDKYDPSDFYFQRIISSESAREKYWKMSTEFWDTMKDALPSRGHFAILKLEASGKLAGIVTQNIDNLHHKTGNKPEYIIEIHGNAFTVSCMSCGKKYDRGLIQERLLSGVKVPYCDDCSGILKPDTVSFGQSMPEDKMTKAYRLAEECDLCIVLGSSLVVYPAAYIPVHAVESGAKLMIINRDKTDLDSKAALVVHDSIGKVFGDMVDRIAPLLQ
ncbi:MAG: SIR2 family NAD-dependent protein deacylase [Deltaproteobacteria bacterium]